VRIVLFVGQDQLINRLQADDKNKGDHDLQIA
jgi:hypothetical protein